MQQPVTAKRVSPDVTQGLMPWDPGHRSYLGALTVSSNEAVSCQIQLDELFVANNWFNFFPLVPEWSAVRFWLPEICVCEMTMTVLCKWFHALGCLSAIQRHYFSLFAVLAEWQSLQVTGHWGWALNEQLPNSHGASRMIFHMHAPSRNPHGKGSPMLSSCSCAMFIATKTWEHCLVRGAALCLSVGKFVSRFWQHFLGYKHPSEGGRVNWQWAGDDLVWVWPQDSALSLLLLAQSRLFPCPGSRRPLLCSLCSFSARGSTWESYITCDSCSSK